jgi:Tfp pilus assembly protein PilF
VWLGQGILGLVAITGIAVVFYLHVVRVLVRAEAGTLFCGAAAGVTATFIHGLADARQYVEGRWVMPALFAGIGLTLACGSRALRRSRLKVRRAEVSPSPWRRTIVVAGTGFLLVTTVAIAFNRTLLALWHTNMGALAETRADAAIVPSLPDAERKMLQGMAAQHYRTALEINPDMAAPNRRLGNLLVDSQEFESAITLLVRAAAREPDNPAAIKGLGLAYMWAGRTDQAAATLSKLASQAEIGNELLTWRQYRVERDQPLLAGYALETALLMSASHTNQPVGLWELVADDYYKGGDYVRARRWYKRVLEHAPGRGKAEAALATLQNERGPQTGVR